jgi:hypothetical protein
MASKGGFLIVFDEERRAELLEEVSSLGQGFSDAISASDWPVKAIEVCGLIFGDDVISHFALARRGRKVATRKWHVSFSDFWPVSVPLARLDAQLKASLRGHFVRSRSGVGGRVPPATWDAFKDALRSSDELAFEAVNRLEQLRDRHGEVIHLEGARTLAQQRDATGLALDVFDRSHRLRKATLGGYIPPANQLTSFLDGVERVRTLEGHLIAHDAVQFPGTDSTQHTAFGAVFGVAGRKLEIFNVDRTRLETTLGVDLIYWNERFDAWTLVQYKAIDARSSSGTFRPDVQFQKELGRMVQFRKLTPDAWAAPSHHASFRLSGDGFFFKFCPRIQVVVHSSDLMQGMYLPRELVQCVQGTKGNVAIAFDSDTPGRHLNNSTFVDLVREGWIGTRGLSSKAVARFIHETFVDGRGLVIARERVPGQVGNLAETVRDLELE